MLCYVISINANYTKKVGGARCQVVAAYVTPPDTPKISKEQKYIIYIKHITWHVINANFT